MRASRQNGRCPRPVAAAQPQTTSAADDRQKPPQPYCLTSCLWHRLPESDGLSVSCAVNPPWRFCAASAGLADDASFAQSRRRCNRQDTFVGIAGAAGRVAFFLCTWPDFCACCIFLPLWRRFFHKHPPLHLPRQTCLRSPRCPALPAISRRSVQAGRCSSRAIARWLSPPFTRTSIMPLSSQGKAHALHAVRSGMAFGHSIRPVGRMKMLSCLIPAPGALRC